MKRGFRKEPAGLCTIRKSTREESIDTLQTTSIDSVNQKSIDSVHHQSIATRQTTVIDRANQPSKTLFIQLLFILILFIKVPFIPRKIEVLILKVDENGMLRDEEGRTRNSA
ncbi:hypothetical protein DY000_02020536 [Brassica cretica]|uniref:Uncharacterized protein n=1 Tax=Brassica cretica TaxID=69181 RepID=A0ABQ7EAC7_BRACR|nr:hypothetical protein DY000_02020536 [Brassica cretica]